jgi:hypothetical protein
MKLLILFVVSLFLMSSQEGCNSFAPRREFLVTQLVYSNKVGEPEVYRIDASRLPREWIEADRISGFDEQVQIEGGHRLTILVLPDEDKDKGTARAPSDVDR